MLNRDDPVILPGVLQYLELASGHPWDPDVVRAEIKKWEQGETVDPLCEKAIESAADRFADLWNGVM